MSNQNTNWHKDYFQKCLTGLIEEKNKVDACVNWLLTMNIAVMSVTILITTKAHLRILLAELGILFTWMIMMRSCRAYRQLVNFSFIIKRLHNFERCPTDRHTEERLIRAIKFLDYPEKGTEPVYLTSRWKVLRINLGHEYGVIIAIYVGLILYHLKNESILFICFSLLGLVLILATTFFTMLYKKEGSIHSILCAGGERPKIRLSIGLGDLYDRMGILKLKTEKLGIELDEYINEIKDCIQQYKSFGIQVSTSDVSEIETINAKIWEIESQLRNGTDSQTDFNKIGKWAVAVRKLNAQRVSLRNRINRETCTGYEEPF